MLIESPGERYGDARYSSRKQAADLKIAVEAGDL